MYVCVDVCMLWHTSNLIFQTVIEYEKKNNKNKDVTYFGERET